MQQIKTYKCSTCKIEQPYENFYKQKGCIDQIYKCCKSCKFKKSQSIINKRREMQSYNLDIKEKKCCRCNIVKLREEFGINNRTKSKIHPRCKECRHKEAKTAKPTLASIYNGVKLGAKKRNLTYCTKEEFFNWFNTTPDYCEYCKATYEEFSKNREKIKSNPKLKRFKEIFACPVHNNIGRLSIDRKNPSYGYELDNIAKACWICNHLKKGIWTDLDLKDLLVKVRKEIEECQK